MKPRLGLRWPKGVLTGVVIVAILVEAFLSLGFPPLAQAIAGSSGPLPVPGTLHVWYVVLVLVALAVYVGSSDAAIADFLAPVERAAAGRSPSWQRIGWMGVLALLPVAAGTLVWQELAPRTSPPVAVRQQHPGMASASAASYAGRRNPLRKLAGPERERALAEGRGLYFKNCQPCHGAKLDGDGPAARAWSLKPISFRDPGTIATLVEDAVFWRVNEGGVGLPPAATPWDSPMPAWRADLTEDELWRIIMAEYADAGVEPRVLEVDHGR